VASPNAVVVGSYFGIFLNGTTFIENNFLNVIFDKKILSFLASPQLQSP
jgi:hypothetical protein